MARPRLVEEGVPIYGPGSDEPSRRIVDHEMDDHDNYGGHDRHKIFYSSSSAPKTVSSSLQAAAKSSGARIPKRRSGGSSTNYEVGNGGRPSDGLQYSTAAPSHPIPVPGPISPATPHLHFPHHHNYNIHQSHTTIGLDNTTSAIHANDMEMESETFASKNSYSAATHHHQQHPSCLPYHQQTNYSIPPSFSRSSVTPTTIVQTTYEIGAVTGPIEKMVGVEDHGHKAPLVVLDGANVAHAYGTAVDGLYSKGRGSSEPDARGIEVAVDYFQTAGVRVLVVLPQYWFGSKPRPGDTQWNVKMDTPQQEVLNTLQYKGLVVASPPADDDDAYALTIARREEGRSLKRNGEGPGFILSNDMFRDAQARDTTDVLKHWLNDGRNDTCGPGRISYSFADMGTLNDNGERILDFVPNPRHPLVIWIEGMSLQGGGVRKL